MQEPGVVDVLLEWIRVRERSGHPLPLGYGQLAEEVERSALLLRMLGGKEPLPAAPPRSFGQPWYALVEEGGAVDCELVPLQDRLGATPKVAINHTAWEVVGTVAEGYVVRYGGAAPLYVAERTQSDPPRWRLSRHDLWLGARTRNDDGATPAR